MRKKYKNCYVRGGYADAKETYFGKRLPDKDSNVIVNKDVEFKIRKDFSCESIIVAVGILTFEGSPTLRLSKNPKVVNPGSA